MSEPTEEQIKELWEWCGLEPIKREDSDEVVRWDLPNGGFRFYAPDIDLNNLFKWAVPKLTETYAELRVIFTYGSVMNCSLYRFGKLYSRKKNFQWIRIGEQSDKDPALALFWAIYKVIKEVEK